MAIIIAKWNDKSWVSSIKSYRSGRSFVVARRDSSRVRGRLPERIDCSGEVSKNIPYLLTLQRRREAAAKGGDGGDGEGEEEGKGKNI